jgi:hypothetical protein
MSNGPQNALVPLRDPLPVRAARAWGRASAAANNANDAPSIDLVSEETSLRDRSQVEKYLPDILGRALARAWIDSGFRAAFIANPVGTLAAHRIHLPSSIRINVVTEGQIRPMVVVSEEGLHGAPARRLLYLQLVMVAGK